MEDGVEDSPEHGKWCWGLPREWEAVLGTPQSMADGVEDSPEHGRWCWGLPRAWEAVLGTPQSMSLLS